MPNWCFNRLTVSGSLESVEGFIKKHSRAIRADIFFQTIIPCPQGLLEMENKQIEDVESAKKLFGYSSVLEFQYEEWGTKWDAYKPNLGAITDCENGFYISLDFDTAWSPPIPIIMRLFELHKDLDLKFEYVEFGMNFCGGLERLADSERIDQYHLDFIPAPIRRLHGDE